MDAPRTPVVVFLGPTIERSVAEGILEADYRPPARMGDIYASLVEGVTDVVLIDGVFHLQPAVWHREIVTALRVGLRVWGGSSMGALRAAELADLGMIGHGTVFRWYMDGTLDGDDEVALLHGDESTGWRALSEPLVNVRATIAHAVDAGRLAAARASEVVDYAKGLHYPDRRVERLLAFAREAEWTAHERMVLETSMRDERVDVKRDDAIGLLRKCESVRHEPLPAPVTGPIHDATFDFARLEHTRFLGIRRATTGAELVTELARAGLLDLVRDVVVRRRFVLDWAELEGIRCPADAMDVHAGAWEEEHGVRVSAAFLRASGLTAAEYRELVEVRAAARWVVSERSERACLVDWARKNGVFGPPGGESSDDALLGWMVARGPRYFGVPYHPVVEAVRELQVTGRLARWLDDVPS